MRRRRGRRGIEGLWEGGEEGKCCVMDGLGLHLDDSGYWIGIETSRV
jgi:hypothetical protein